MTTYQIVLAVLALLGLGLSIWVTPTHDEEFEPSFARGMITAIGLVVAIVATVLLVLESVLP